MLSLWKIFICCPELLQLMQVREADRKKQHTCCLGLISILPIKNIYTLIMQ